MITTAPAQRSVTLAWDPSVSDGIAGYRVYQGGASRAYTNVIPVGLGTSNTVPGLIIGATYWFAVTAFDTNGLESDFSNEVSYTVPAPKPAPGLTFAADSGVFALPFTASEGELFQPFETNLADGGRAVYSFNIVKAGHYLVSAMVRASSDAQNSFYVNMDAEPTDPLMIWDIPVAASQTSRIVSWRGNGSGDPAAAQYIPKVFRLSEGTHQLVIRGREANTGLGTITIAAAPPRLDIRRIVTTPDPLGGSPLLTTTAIILNATGLAGEVYDILRSQDLRSWAIIGTLALDATGEGEFTDPAGDEQPSRMYRLQAR